MSSLKVTHHPSANDRQVGGQHYQRGGEQHWDRIWRLYGPGYFIGCITKYLERYQDKNGLEDLKKAQHFLEKLIELEGMLPKEMSKEQLMRAIEEDSKPTGYYVDQDRAGSRRFDPPA